MSDLFPSGNQKTSYDAREIEVLEGLEPVRHRQACMLAVQMNEHSII